MLSSLTACLHVPNEVEWDPRENEQNIIVDLLVAHVESLKVSLISPRQ